MAQISKGRIGQVAMLDPDSPVALRDQVCELISRQISFGQIGVGHRLPSSRTLAKQLNIARNTVIGAYQILIQDGLIEAAEKSGYFVAKSALVMRPTNRSEQEASRLSIFDKHPLALPPSRQQVIERPENWSAMPYPFVCNQLDRAEFPLSAWRQCTQQSLSRVLAGAVTSDHHYGDCEELISQIRARILPHRGILATRDEVLVVSGAQQAIYIVASLLGGADRAIHVEDPCYPDARNVFRRHFGEVRPVPVDGEGLRTDLLSPGMTAIYVTPSQQFPMGVALSTERRKALLGWAERNGTVVIEDDYDAEVDFNPDRKLALRASADGAHVIYVGSLSKSLTPGVRLGYLVGPADFIREARALSGMMIRHTPPMVQLATAQFIRMGHYDGRLGRLRNLFVKRLAALREAVAEHLPNAALCGKTLGSSLLLRLEGVDMELLYSHALQRGIVFDRLAPCFSNRADADGLLRLGVSAIPEDAIRSGITALAELTRQCEG